jgi:hypothetical protein
MIGKVANEDLEKVISAIRASRNSSYITILADGPKILFTFTGDDGKLVTVTLFDTAHRIAPTITRTESL